MTPNPAFIDGLRASVREAPYPQLIGLELAAIDFDTARIDLQIAPRHLQPFGIVHGGVLATLLDTATFWAGYLRLPQGTGLVNVDLKLNYLKAVTSGALRTEGRCLRFGRQVSVTEATVYDERGERVAHALSTLMAMPGKDLELGVPKFVD